MTARGVLQIHSAPPALSPHIEWAVAGIFGVPVKLHWIEQPAAPGSVRTELDWQGRPGTSGEIASALASWNLLRFEISEEASQGCDAVRYSFTPELGMFSAAVSVELRCSRTPLGALRLPRTVTWITAPARRRSHAAAAVWWLSAAPSPHASTAAIHRPSRVRIVWPTA